MAAGTKHDRQLGGINAKTFDERFRLVIVVGIKQLMRMTVVTQKALEPQHIAVFGVADNDRPAGSDFKQADAAKDQCAHDPFAKLGFGNQKRAQPLRRYNESFDRLLGNGVGQRRPAGKLRQFAHELAGAVGDNDVLAQGFVLDDVDLAGEDDDKPWANLTGGDDHFVLRKVPRFTEPAHPLDLQGIELRKHLVASAFKDRRW